MDPAAFRARISIQQGGPQPVLQPLNPDRFDMDRQGCRATPPTVDAPVEYWACVRNRPNLGPVQDEKAWPDQKQITDLLESRSAWTSFSKPTNPPVGWLAGLMRARFLLRRSFLQFELFFCVSPSISPARLPASDKVLTFRPQ